MDGGFLQGETNRERIATLHDAHEAFITSHLKISGRSNELAGVVSATEGVPTGRREPEEK